MSAAETRQMPAAEMEDQLLEASWRRLGGCSLAACGAAEAIRSSEGGGGGNGGVVQRGIRSPWGRITGGGTGQQDGISHASDPKGSADFNVFRGNVGASLVGRLFPSSQKSVSGQVRHRRVNIVA